MKRWLVLIGLCFFLATGAVVLAQSSASFEVGWSAVGVSSGTSSSASYEISGTAGQALAGPPASDSSSYRVISGVWALPSGQTGGVPALGHD
jgi:hypothetical protein